MLSALSCEQVQRYVSDYVEDALSAAVKASMDSHFLECERCAHSLAALKNVLRLVGDETAFPVPEGFSEKLYAKVDELIREHDSAVENDLEHDIPVGVTNDKVPLGSHLIYFWKTQQDFAKGVRFLYPGLGTDEHCIIFGHTEALDRVRLVLRADGYDPDRLQREGKLTVLHRHAANRVTLTEIAFAIERAMHGGARLVRFLGNLGVERDPLPAGEDDVVELEARAGALVSKIPAVIVCMYDVSTLSANMMMKGGLEHHELSICNEAVHKNPFNLPTNTQNEIHLIN